MKNKKEVLILLLGLMIIGSVSCATDTVTEPELTSSPTATSTSAQATASSRIALTYDCAESMEIFVVDPDGSNLTRLTNNSVTDYWPVWSPDGSRIAFLSYFNTSTEYPYSCQNIYDLYVMDADGSNLTKLATDASIQSWSPNGQKIAFASNRDGNYEIYVINSDGSNLTRLTYNSVDDAHPVWSPDGEKIAYQSSCGRETCDPRTQPDIYVMDADGSNPKNITNDPSATDWDHSWSPDGSKIAFQHSETNSYIYMVDYDGSNLTRLTAELSDSFLPIWSPDGKKIAFTSNVVGGSYEIYVMDCDGTNLTRLTNSAGIDEYSLWSPDGQKIAFVSKRDGVHAIYVMNADGSNQTRITFNPEQRNFHDISWSPEILP